MNNALHGDGVGRQEVTLLTLVVRVELLLELVELLLILRDGSVSAQRQRFLLLLVRQLSHQRILLVVRDSCQTPSISRFH